MNIEDKAKQIIDDFKKKMLIEMDEAIGNCYSEILPHVENDTYMNVQCRSEAVIKNLLAGNIEKDKDGKGVYIKDDNGLSVHIVITDNMYDQLRDTLIQSMPVCPKDMKIKALELDIKHMQEHKY